MARNEESRGGEQRSLGGTGHKEAYGGRGIGAPWRVSRVLAWSISATLVGILLQDKSEKQILPPAWDRRLPRHL